MIVRLATAEELPMLARELPDTAELTLGRVWVGVEDDVIVGVLPMRLCWFPEPLLLMPQAKRLPKITKSRCALMLYLAAEDFIRSPLNRSGPKWLIAVTYESRVKEWADRLLWRRIYRGAAFFVKHLR